MGVIDLLVTIIVVTILVTIALGVMTYIAYKLRLSRRPVSADEDATGPRFFVLNQPPATGARSSEGHVAQA
jgi:Tfp pilus assembly protein PilE